MTEEWGITKTSSAYERAIPDAELLRATRSGDLEMFEVLWQRYSGQLLGYARKRVPAHQAEDAVSEVLLSTLRAILNGSGPDRFFRAYAFQALRRALGRQTEAAALAPPLDHEDLERLAPAAARPRSEDAMLVNSLLAEFDDETQLLLRLNLEEGRRIGDIAVVLSLAPEVASRRLYEAKDAFRAKWFAAHLDLVGAEPECMAAMALAPHAFGRSAGGAKSREFWAHVEGCSFCGPRVSQAQSASQRLVVQWPVAFGAFAIAEPGGLVLQALGWGAGAGVSHVPGLVVGGLLTVPVAAKVGAGALAVVVAGTAIVAGTVLNSKDPGPTASMPGRGAESGISAPASPGGQGQGEGGLEPATASPGSTQSAGEWGLIGTTTVGGLGAGGLGPAGPGNPGGLGGAGDDANGNADDNASAGDPGASGGATAGPGGTPGAGGPGSTQGTGQGTQAPPTTSPDPATSGGNSDNGADSSGAPSVPPTSQRPVPTETTPTTASPTESTPPTGRQPCDWAPNVACYAE